MKPYFKDLILTFVILTLFGSLWVLNQRRNYNPVLSFKNNLNFKTDSSVNYDDLSSVVEVYEKLNLISSNYKLSPIVNTSDLSVIGRNFIFENHIISVFEFENPKTAQYEFNTKSIENPQNFYLYKNLIISSNITNDVWERLHDAL